MLYVYDQYTIHPEEWRKVLGHEQNNNKDDLSIRGTQYDVIALGITRRYGIIGMISSWEQEQVHRTIKLIMIIVTTIMTTTMMMMVVVVVGGGGGIFDGGYTYFCIEYIYVRIESETIGINSNKKLRNRVSIFPTKCRSRIR